MDLYKLYGELIIANLYRLNNETSQSITLENYYDNNNLITIPINTRFSISDNAKNYFKKYNKLKSAFRSSKYSKKKEAQKRIKLLRKYNL